jgi:chromosomal replication initiator protein
MRMTNEVSYRFISIAEIQHTVAAAFSLTRADLLSRSRERHIACARHIAMYLSREMARGSGGTGAAERETPRTSYPRLGMAFGRDHTSVMHACNSIGRKCKADSRFARMVDGLAGEVRGLAERMTGKAAA